MSILEKCASSSLTSNMTFRAKRKVIAILDSLVEEVLQQERVRECNFCAYQGLTVREVTLDKDKPAQQVCSPCFGRLTSDNLCTVCSQRIEGNEFVFKCEQCPSIECKQCFHTFFNCGECAMDLCQGCFSKTRICPECDAHLCVGCHANANPWCGPCQEDAASTTTTPELSD